MAITHGKAVITSLWGEQVHFDVGVCVRQREEEWITDVVTAVCG